MGPEAADLAFLGAFQLAALSVFLVAFGARTVHLRLRDHINPITLSLGKRGLLGAVELALFAAVNLWALAVVERALPGLRAPLPAWLQTPLLQSPALQLLGVFLTIAAFLICLLALRELGSSWRLGIDEKRPGKLVTTGIYRFSRNPIFLFFDLYFVGTFFLNGAMLFLLFALFTILNLHYQILQEEHFLAQAHGSAYEHYRRKTCRYATWDVILSLLSGLLAHGQDQPSVMTSEDTAPRGS